MSPRQLVYFHVAQICCLGAVFALTGYLSIFKGWAIFIVWPLLVITIPLVIYQQVRLALQLRRAIAHKRDIIMSILQLVCFFVFYACMPGIGDTERYYAFGRYLLTMDNQILVVLNVVTLISGVLFCINTIRFGWYLRTNKKLYSRNTV